MKQSNGYGQYVLIFIMVEKLKVYYVKKINMSKNTKKHLEKYPAGKRKITN